MEKLRLERISERKESGGRGQRVPASRLYELRKEPFRIREEVTGMPSFNHSRASMPSGKVETVVAMRGEPEDTSKRLSLAALLEEVRRGGRKERADFISRRMEALIGNSSGHLISFVRRNIAGLENSLGYCLVGDVHRAVRDYMRTIGWYEKLGSQKERGVVTRALQRPNSRENSEAAAVFKEAPVKFIWVNGYVNWTAIRPGTIVSRIPSTNAYFSKTSLSTSLKDQTPFIYKKGEIHARIPRTYEVRVDDGDLKHFSKHFRITACVCLLKKFHSDMCKDEKSIADVDGTVPMDCVDFALKRVVELIRFTEHADLDDWCFSVVKDEDWDLFLLRFYDILHYDAKFQIKTKGINVPKLLTACQKVLDYVFKYFPEMKYEGTLNLWICKPANGSCGRGVRVFRKLEDIQNYCRPNLCYVIQKYIELPLLIYNTKFDIRQWFVITSVSPLCIWMYNECYLRFCSQEFSLKNLHESIHLCNNTIQWKYKNGVRSTKLPSDNMWDNYTFADFLRKELKTDQWLNIQDQMRQAITAACVATQDKMFHRPNSFHLYGADFMLTPDLQVWLIEINSQPSMKYSTSVTARMCKAVLEDTIKVGLERSLNPSAPVGKFREIYRQSKEPCQAILPFGGIVHSRRSKILQRKPFLHSGRGAMQSKQARRKWISYEEIADYKRHSMLSVVSEVRASQPLDPGDATVSTKSSSVVINEVAPPVEGIAARNAEKVGGSKEEVTPTKPAAKNNIQTKEDPVGSHSANERRQNMLGKKKKKGQKVASSDKHIDAPTSNEKNPKTTDENNNTQCLQKAIENRLVSKEELLNNPGALPKNVLELAKKALSNKTCINVKQISPKNRISLASKWKKQGMKLVLVPNEEGGDNYCLNNLDDSDLRKYNSMEKDYSNLNNGTTENKEALFYEEGDLESDMQLYFNCKGDENYIRTSSNLDHPKENEGIMNGLDVSRNSSSIDFLFDVLDDEENELSRELSGLAIIGESAADRTLENILNSDKYLKAIGKSENKSPPTFKSIVCEKRDRCE